MYFGILAKVRSAYFAPSITMMDTRSAGDPPSNVPDSEYGEESGTQDVVDANGTMDLVASLNGTPDCYVKWDLDG